MEIGILTLFLFGLLAMATEIFHHINKAAVAIFIVLGAVHLLWC